MTEEEGKQIIKDYLENLSNVVEAGASTFVIPFVAMNNGSTPAQIRASSKGLYKDIQRSPFIRRSGVFNEKNAIEDIDITRLVRYGTLEKSRIAPTLENVDIRLYVREPNLKKIPNFGKLGDYADKYAWREIPVGFHVYNNDTVYGYDWVILQDDYARTDGIYNLHMNIEDGLGVCKFGGTQAPIALKGVQYKIIITAKNLWSREYSLLESNQAAQNLYTDSDALMPSINAVRNFYKEALYTLKALSPVLYIGPDKEVEEDDFRQKEKWYENYSFGFVADKDGAAIKKLALGSIVDVEKQINEIIEKHNAHEAHLIDNPAKDDDGKLLGVHGILNKGASGNIDAKKLSGATLSNGAEAISENVSEYSYIPFVNVANEGADGVIGLGNVTEFYQRAAGKSPSILYSEKIQSDKNNGVLSFLKESKSDEVNKLFERISFGGTGFSKTISADDGLIDIVFKHIANGKKVGLTIDKVNVETLSLGENVDINAAIWLAATNGSSIAYKKPISERIDFNWKDYNGAELKTLVPNTDKDSEGNPVYPLDSSNWNTDGLYVPENLESFLTDDAEAALTKLGSALQALYELPLGTYVYKRGQEEYKEQLGIFVERVNQIRDKIVNIANNGARPDGSFDARNLIVHKKNSRVQSSNSNVKGYKEGADVLSLKETNDYSYTEEELKSIVHYLNLFTSKKELAQELRNTVGVLLNAAKETQTRLLDLETSVYGWDSPTLPGQSDTIKNDFVEKHIAEELRDQINAGPLILGINRILRAVCLEVFDTTDLEKIEAEEESRVTDSDNGEKVSIKSRMDKIDEITSNIFNQISGLVEFLNNQKMSEGAQTYTELVDAVSGLPVESDVHTFKGLQAENELEKSLISKTLDDHDEFTNISDAGGLWKNLPSKEEIDSKNDIEYAQVSPHVGKHSPSVYEVGTVRTPVVLTAEDVYYGSYINPEGAKAYCVITEAEFNSFSSTGEATVTIQGKSFNIINVAKHKANISQDFNPTDHVDVTSFVINDANKKIARTWNLLDIDKRRNSAVDDFASSGSYDAFYVTKGVAWEKAKLERLNKKVSEVTKAVYGVDDVVAKYPNRMETLRRNITNVVDDLYPNRYFSIEPVAAEPSMVLPFKGSNTVDILSGSSFPVSNNDNPISHTSIIKYFDKELFDFELENNYVGANLKDALRSNNQYSENNNTLSFSTAKLITDPAHSVNGFGTYAKAISRVDLLEKAVGLKNIFFGDVLYNGAPTSLRISGSQVSYLDSLGQLAAGNLADTVNRVSSAKKEWETATANKVELENKKTYIDDQLTRVAGNLNNVSESLTTKNTTLLSTKSELNSATNALNNQDKATSIQSQIDNINAEILSLDERIASHNAAIAEEESAITNYSDAAREAVDLQHKSENLKVIYDKMIGMFNSFTGDLDTEAVNKVSVNGAWGVSDWEQFTDITPQNVGWVKGTDLDNYQDANDLKDLLNGGYTPGMTTEDPINISENLIPFRTRFVPITQDISGWANEVIYYNNERICSLHYRLSARVGLGEPVYINKNVVQGDTAWVIKLVKSNAQDEKRTHKIVTEFEDIQSLTYYNLYASLTASDVELIVRDEDGITSYDASNFPGPRSAEDVLMDIAVKKYMGDIDTFFPDIAYNENATSLDVWDCYRSTYNSILYLQEKYADKYTTIWADVKNRKFNDKNFNADNENFIRELTKIKNKEGVPKKPDPKKYSYDITPLSKAAGDRYVDEYRKYYEYYYKAAFYLLVEKHKAIQSAFNSTNNYDGLAFALPIRYETRFAAKKFSYKNKTVYSVYAVDELGTSTLLGYSEDSDFEEKFSFSIDARPMLNNAVNTKYSACAMLATHPPAKEITLLNPERTSLLELLHLDTWETYQKSLARYDASFGTIEKYSAEAASASELKIKAEERKAFEEAGLTSDSNKKAELENTKSVLLNQLNSIENNKSFTRAKEFELSERVTTLSNEISQLTTLRSALTTEKNELTTQKSDVTSQLAVLNGTTAKSISYLKAAYDNAYNAALANGSKGIPSYLEEIQTKEYSASGSSINLINGNSPLAKNTETGWALSRKEKSLADRVTTNEAFLDGLSSAAYHWADLTNNSPISAATRSRFEKTDAVNYLDQALNYVNTLRYKKTAMIFDLDLANSWKDNVSYNAKIFQVLEYMENVEKSDFVVDPTTEWRDGYYTITGTFKIDSSLLPLSLPTSVSKPSNPSTLLITVNYVKTGAKTQPNVSGWNIYLQSRRYSGANKSIVDESSFNGVFGIKDGSSNASIGFEDQTEHNIYMMVHNLFYSLLTPKTYATTEDSINNTETGLVTDPENDLYYRVSLNEHPIGDVVTFMPVSGKSRLSPAARWGGTWKRLKDGFLVDNNAAPTISSNNNNYIELAANIDRSQIPLHIHNFAQNHTHLLENQIVLPSDPGIAAEGISEYQMYFSKDVHNATALAIKDKVVVSAKSEDSGTFTGGTNTEGGHAPLKIKNIPHINVEHWVRIA